MGIKDTWAITANGKRAKLISYLGAANSQTIELIECEQQVGPGQSKDRPGRTYASHGSGRSGIEPHSDPVRINEIQFAEKLAAKLQQADLEKKFGTLIIAAAPETLGDLREKLSAGKLNADLVERHSDYTKLTDRELTERMLLISSE